LTVDYEEVIYDRYNYGYPGPLLQLKGFFDFVFISKLNIEYINPPLMLSKNWAKSKIAFMETYSRGAIKSI
jgi:hypothetical protein